MNKEMITSDTNCKAVDTCNRQKMDVLFSNIRRQIEHEDNLVNQRLTWLLGVQAFLFSGYYLVITTQVQIPRQQYIIMIICLVGIAFTLATYNGILAAFKSLKKLHVSWYQFVLNEKICFSLRSDKEHCADDLLTSNCIGLKNNIDNELLLRYGYPQVTWRGNGPVSAANTASMFPIALIFIWICLFTFKITDKVVIFGTITGLLIITFLIVVVGTVSIMLYVILLKNR